MSGQTVVLVRHGETALNADGKLRGLANPDLNEVGIRQAQALASALSGHARSVVVSSPLRRAVHTAAIIADGVDCAHRIDADFNDRDYGTWTGQPKADVVAQWGSVDAAPGVELSSSVVARARPALDAWIERAQIAGQRLIIVTHDAVIRPLLAEIAPAHAAFTVPTGSYQRMNYHRGTWTIEDSDCVPS